ncbi:MAG: XdhC family protein [Anaerolineales bacterium]|nr:XdhC family protein [Anaerolineales bacterium]
MKSFEQQVAGWLQDGQQVAVATVVAARQPSPRDVGARMALSDHGRVAGSVTWGCVESAVMEEAQQVLADGRTKMLHFGTVTDTTFEIGLTCGGDMDIYVERLDPHHWLQLQQRLNEILLAGSRCAIVTVVDGDPDLSGTKLLLENSGSPVTLFEESAGNPAFHQEIAAASRETFKQGVSSLVDTSGLQLFIDVFLPPPRIVIVGAGHVSIPLVTFAATLGYHTYVVDPRSSILTEERFSHATKLFPEWPTTALQKIPMDSQTFLVLVTHDPKLDDPAILLAIEHEIPYIGALGSQRTHEKRLARLREAGLSEEQLQRLFAPIGLDLGGREPEEIALAIMAEIVRVRRGKDRR